MDTDTTTMDTLDEIAIELTDDERVTLMIQKLDNFLSVGATRSLVPMAEVMDLVLDLRLILKPVSSGLVEPERMG